MRPLTEVAEHAHCSAAGGPPLLVRCDETIVPADDSHRLFVRHYRPAARTERTLLVAHGVSEHGERYDHVARFAVERAWNVIIADHRGHGRSDGVPTHIDNFHQYAQDLEALRRHFELRPESTALLGHSMGGLIAIRFAQLFHERVAALALMSPLLRVKVPIPWRTVALGRLLSLVHPRVRFRSHVDPADTTRSQAVLAKRAQDQLLHRSVTAGWFFAMRGALLAAWREADQLRLPLLVMQGGEDRLVDPTAAEAWFQTVSSPDKTFRLLPEHYHELLNEPDWPETAAFVLDWLDARVPAGAAVSRRSTG